jgi:formylmethanofuran dehydrogenase subunit E
MRVSALRPPSVAAMALLGACGLTRSAEDEYAAMAGAPAIAVVDTVSSLGPLAALPRTVGLRELVAWHGHPCDGLVAAAVGLAYGLPRLFPDGPVDRTDLCAAANRSACYGDVAAFLTGSRHRYGSLTIDPGLGDEWILHRRSTGTTLRVRLRPGIKPAELPGLEAQLRAAACPPELMARVAELQDAFSRRLLGAGPEELFELEFLADYPYPLGEPRPDTVKRGCPDAR